MGELTEPVPEEQPGVAVISHRRLLIQMAAVTVLMSLVVLFAVSARFAGGILAGGILAFANYFWLKSSLRALFSHPGEGTGAVLLSLKYILRYALLGAVLYAIFITGAFPVVAVVAGLGSFALAVVSEGLYNIFSTFNRREI